MTRSAGQIVSRGGLVGLPGDTTLADLHETIQAAFDWRDSHLHVFETPYGEFGRPNQELGHRSERPVTLEQVAATVGSTISYLYDFGDNWEHEILVEKIVEPDPAVVYPRCSDGQRAAPPEDCGGVWGYADLLGTLGDPSHPEHEEVLELLELVDPDDFDLDYFCPDDVNRMLAMYAAVDEQFGPARK